MKVEEVLLKEIARELEGIRKELHTITSSMKPITIPELDGKELEDAINKLNHEKGFTFR